MNYFLDNYYRTNESGDAFFSEWITLLYTVQCKMYMSPQEISNIQLTLFYSAWIKQFQLQVSFNVVYPTKSTNSVAWFQHLGPKMSIYSLSPACCHFNVGYSPVLNYRYKGWLTSTVTGLTTNSAGWFQHLVQNVLQLFSDLMPRLLSFQRWLFSGS